MGSEENVVPALMELRGPVRGTEGKGQWTNTDPLSVMATKEKRETEAGPQGSLCGQERLL